MDMDNMQLLPPDCRLFYKLHTALMCYGNNKLKTLPEQPADPTDFYALEPPERAKVRDDVHGHPELIDLFVADNPFGFDAEELVVVRSWKHAVRGSFYIFRYLKPHTIFLTSGSEPKAYGVLALADRLEDLVGARLPRLIQTVLLPFQGKIVYDGLLSGHNITFGGGIKRILNDSYRETKRELGIITKLPFGGEEPEVQEEPKAIIVTPGRCEETHETTISGNLETTTFPLRLTQAQRKVIAGQLASLRPDFQLDKKNQRTLQFTLNEIKEIATKCAHAARDASSGMERNSLCHVVDAAKIAIERFGEGKIHRIPAAGRLYQFKITLRDIEPPIWRRIQMKDGSLDRLHEHIQTSMGWTNSHLHQFTVDGVLYGDPDLLLQGFENDPEIVNSLDTRLSEIIPQSGSRFTFAYEYDFGDCWEHDVLFEGCLRAEKGGRYPLCLEGERACPPEDVGGTSGYLDYLETLSNPDHEQWEESSEWQGPCRPEEFDAAVATQRMRRGLPNWRHQEL